MNAARGAVRLPWHDGLTFLVLGLAAMGASAFTPKDNWNVLGFFGLLGLGFALARAWRLFRMGQDAVVSNVLLTFTLAFSIFFLFGPLLHVFGPAVEADLARSWYPVAADQAVFLMGTNLLGFGIALICADALRWKWFSDLLALHFSGLPRGDFRRMAQLLLVVGLIFKAYVLYNDIVLDQVISGLFRLASLMAPAGIFLYVYKTGLRPTPTLALAVVAMVVYALSGIVEFSKTETFIPLLAMIGGILAKRVTLPRLLFSGVLVGTALAILQPLNLEARNEALRLVAPTYRERLDIFLAALEGEFEIDPTETMGAWGRVDYTSPQQAAMDLYRQGHGGTDMTRMMWVFVPRFLFPNKPIITGASVEFTYKIRGIDTSATAMGVFINGFYNLGWAGLFLASAMVGIILSWFRAVLEAAQRADSILLLCVGLFGHMTAILISGTFLANFLGPFVTMIYLLTGLLFALTRLRPQRRLA